MSYIHYKEYEDKIIPFIDYSQYPYAWYPFKERVSVINEMDMDKFTINKELYDMIDWEVFEYTLSNLITINDAGPMFGTNLLQIPNALIDHYGIYRIKFKDNYNTILNASIIFSFPYLNYIKLQKIWEQRENDIWRMYWINPRYFQYQSIVPCLCFIFNSFEGHVLLEVINEFFIEKYGEPVFYRHRKPTESEINLYYDNLIKG